MWILPPRRAVLLPQLLPLCGGAERGAGTACIRQFDTIKKQAKAFMRACSGPKKQAHKPSATTLRNKASAVLTRTCDRQRLGLKLGKDLVQDFRVELVQCRPLPGARALCCRSAWA